MTTALWTGRILSGLAVVFLLFDGAIKLIPLDVVIETSKQLGIPTDLAVTLGFSRWSAPCSMRFRKPRFWVLSC